MRSLISRSVLEWAARAVVLAAVGALLGRAFGAGEEERRARVSSSELSRALREWTLDPRINDVTVAMDAAPPADQREWLRALSRGGARVRWNGDPSSLAIAVSVAATPRPAYQIRVATAGEGGAVVADDMGAIATLANARSHVVRVPALAGTVHAVEGAEFAHAPAPSVRPRIRRLAVIGPAGWESKFIVRALEEEGWTVDVRLDVAPGVSVGSFALASLDTSRYSSAVVVGRVSDVAVQSLVAFARSGGGVVLAGEAVSRAGSASPAASVRRVPARYTATVAHASLAGLVFPSLRGGAVAMESRRGLASVAGRRVGAGRVVAVGYDETWRWRMQGGATGLREHREWWSALAGGVAYAPDTGAVRSGGDPAPLAALHSDLGPPTDVAAGAAASRFPLDAVLYALTVMALLAEVASRRRRGLA